MLKPLPRRRLPRELDDRVVYVLHEIEAIYNAMIEGLPETQRTREGLQNVSEKFQAFINDTYLPCVLPTHRISLVESHRTDRLLDGTIVRDQDTGVFIRIDTIQEVDKFETEARHAAAEATKENKCLCGKHECKKILKAMEPKKPNKAKTPAKK